MRLCGLRKQVTEAKERHLQLRRKKARIYVPRGMRAGECLGHALERALAGERGRWKKAWTSSREKESLPSDMDAPEDADPGPQDLLLWPQYTNTHRLQKSCGGKGMVWPLPQEENAPDPCLDRL